MTIHRIRLADAPALPWRNGGGLTRELLAWPAGQRWQLRVSVATIAAPGPFSAFPGVQRWFAVLSGAGVVLTLPQGESVRVPGDDALGFDGEAAPGCRLIGGPTEDLNFMVQRDAGRSRMWRAAAGDTVDGATRWRGLYAAQALLLDIDGQTEPVAAGTLAWSDAAEAGPCRVQHGAAWFMTLAD